MKGFTLIEILIYSALVALMMSFAVMTTYSLMDNAARTQQKNALLENQEFVLAKLQWVLSGVTAINNPAADGTPGAILSVDKVNSLQNPFVLDLQSGALRLSRAGGQPIALTNSSITVSNLSFTNIVSGTNSTIRATATLTNAVGSLPFQTTVTIK